MKKIGYLLFLLLLVLVGCENTSYNVKFVDWDNSIIEEFNVKKNVQITAPKVPIREGYAFIGWDKDFNKAKENLVIQAMYEPKSFLVIFKGIEGEVLKEEVVFYGKDATAPSITNPSGAKFVKWDINFTNVKEDLIVNAEFEKNTFIVKFFGLDNELIKEEIVEYGKSATAPIAIGNQDYQFSKWDKEFNNVQENLEVKALFVEKEYSLQFYDGTTELFLDVSSYKKKDNFTLPIPTKEGHEFIGWFLSDISLYEVESINDKITGDLKLYSRWVRKEQDKLTIPLGAIEFESINKNPHSSGVGFVYQPKFPAGVMTTSVLQYNWASSNVKIAQISAYSSISIVSSGYAIITGTLKSDPNYILYCVIKTSADGVTKVTLEEANSLSYVYATFNYEDGSSIRKIVSKGGYVIPPTATPKEGYTFVGWEGLNGETIYNITKDTTFTAKYTEGTKSYLGKTISVLGDSISTYAGYIPENFAYFYPYPTADLGDVNQTWWMQFINYYGMKLLVNNSWSGSSVFGTASSAAQNKERLEHLFIGDVTPDVILIFMGANDAPSPYISLTQFDDAYGKMIQNIKEMSPNSEIIICTLPSISLYSEKAQVEYNEVIKKHAIKNGITILDFEKAFTRQESSSYLVDSAHPNIAGMNKLAEIAISELLK